MLDDAARRAAALWNASGVVSLVPAEADEEPDVVVSWHGAEAGPSCQPFGSDAAAAHTGPPHLPMFVHLDASRPWDARPDSSAEWLTGALLHEFGHVLGLGHSSDPDALMFADTHAATPEPADLAGLHSLYGGGEDRIGDLIVARAVPDTCLVLRGIAPPGTAWCTFDADGDGAADLLVWSVAADGLGALQVFFFAAGPQGPHLTRTVGPLLGSLPPYAVHRFHVAADGRRWLHARFPDGKRRVLQFTDSGALVRAGPLDAHAVMQSLDAGAGRDVESPADGIVRTDVDGDGRVEALRLR